MATIRPEPPRVETDFTDALLTGQGGWALVARLARDVDLPARLATAVQVKRRRRGASDAEMLWSLIGSLTAGNGALSDVDALRGDAAGRCLLGLEEAPSGRRLGEYLARFGADEIAGLEEVVRDVSRSLAPSVVTHEVEERGYVPVFIDGTAIEVEGALFEGAGVGYDGSLQYWLHSVFVGGLWTSARLHPGGVDVAGGWREQLERDVAPLLGPDTPVWLHADNAYYRRAVIDYCHAHGWDYSISVTHDGYKRPVLEVVEDLPHEAWQPIGAGERATVVYYRPADWSREHAYVVVRRDDHDGQRQLLPTDTVILVSRDDLALETLVQRHRAKQGQENAFKGPLIDLDLHHPPCRGFRANQAVYLCGQLAQLLLRGVQYRLLPSGARRHGLRPLIRHLVRTTARLVRSARRWRLDFAKNAPRLDWLVYASFQLE